MSKSKTIIILILIAIIITVIINIFNSQKNEGSEINTPTEVANAIEQTEVDASGEVTGSSNLVASAASSYVDYNPDLFARTAKSGDSAVLFFHASWCPSCRVLNKDIEKNIDQIPEGVTIFKVDYDSNGDLRSEYGINYQHSFVLVDEELNGVAKWAGSSNLQEVIETIEN